MLPPSRLFSGLVGLLALAPACRAAPPCDLSPGTAEARLAQVGPRLDVILADGRMVYFPTIEPPRATSAEPRLPEDVANELKALLRDRSLRLQPLGGALSLVIARRDHAAFERAGLDESRLVNKWLRVRGVAEVGVGPQIQLFHPGQIEAIEEAPQAGGPGTAESPRRD